MNNIPHIIITVTISLIIFLVARVIEKHSKIAHIKFICDIVKLASIVGGMFFLARWITGNNTLGGSILTSSSLIIAVATFAAQKSLGNVISGFAISLSRPIQIGQKVKITSSGGVVIAEGIVQDLSLRHTVIKTFAGNDTIIPNQVLDESIIENSNYSENVGYFFEVGIGYNDDIRKAIDDIVLVANQDERIIRVSEPTCASFNDSSVTLKCRVVTKTVDDNFAACSDLRINLIEKFKEDNIHIPFQHVTITKD